MRSLLFIPCLIFFAMYVAALPSSRKGMPTFKQSNRGIGYLVAKESEEPRRAMFAWEKKNHKYMQRANESKIESKKVKINALLLCQEDCNRIWSSAHPSTFWGDCNECCRKIGDAVAYC